MLDIQHFVSEQLGHLKFHLKASVLQLYTTIFCQ